MKILLRDDTRGHYWAKDGQWVPDLADALDFRTLVAAGQIARSNSERDVSVVLRYENPLCELALNPDYCI